MSKAKPSAAFDLVPVRFRVFDLFLAPGGLGLALFEVPEQDQTQPSNPLQTSIFAAPTHTLRRAHKADWVGLRLGVETGGKVLQQRTHLLQSLNRGLLP